GRILQLLPPEGCVGRTLRRRVALRAGTIGRVLGEYARERSQCGTRLRALDGTVVKLADAVVEQGHAVAVDGQVMHAAIPEEVSGTQNIQTLHCQWSDTGIQRGVAVCTHRLARLLIRAGTGGQIDDLQAWAQLLVDLLIHGV